MGFGGEVHRRGRLCEKPPPVALSFGTFLGETRKVHELVKLKFDTYTERAQWSFVDLRTEERIARGGIPTYAEREPATNRAGPMVFR